MTQIKKWQQIRSVDGGLSLDYHEAIEQIRARDDRIEVLERALRDVLNERTTSVDKALRSHVALHQLVIELDRAREVLDGNAEGDRR